MNNFKVVAVDTDSLFLKKENQEPFTDDEFNFYQDQLNSLYPDMIRWEKNGRFIKLVTLKAKNYIMYDGKKISLKGSSLKSSTIEPRLKDFLNEMINALVFDTSNYTEIYNKYVNEILSVIDIKPWASKKTISTKTMENDRTNEAKIRAAFEGTEYVEGDKIYLFYREDSTLALIENFKGDHDKKRLLKKLYLTTKRFETVLDIDSYFINYALVKNYKVLIEKGLQPVQ